MIKKSFAIFIVMLIFGAAIRFINIGQPLLEYNATRQVETAMIARNFMNGGFNFLYPEVDDNGSGPSFLMQEFPLITAPISIVCFFIGGIPEWLLRGSSLIFFILACLLFFKLTKYLYKDTIAVLASAIFILSPSSILMGRTFQPDMAMVSLIMLCLYSFLRWQESNSRAHMLFAIIGFTGAVLLKITNLYIVLPILFLIFTDHKKNTVSYWGKILLFFTITSIPILWWWGYHTTIVRDAFPIPQSSTFNAKYLISSMKFFLTHPPFYAEIFKHMMTALTPIVFILFLYGALFKKGHGKRIDIFLYMWLLGLVLFFGVVPEQSKQEYYMLSVVPVASIFAAQGAVLLFERFKKSAAARFIMLSAALLTSLCVVYIVLPKYINRPIYAAIVEAGKAVNRISEKDALIIASHGYGPDLLYYCNRKGWGFLIDERDLKKYFATVKIDYKDKSLAELIGPIDNLESLRKKGAAYFVIAGVNDLKKCPEFENYITKNYRLIDRKGDSYAIFDIKEKMAP